MEMKEGFDTKEIEMKMRCATLEAALNEKQRALEACELKLHETMKQLDKVNAFVTQNVMSQALPTAPSSASLQRPLQSMPLTMQYPIPVHASSQAQLIQTTDFRPASVSTTPVNPPLSFIQPSTSLNIGQLGGFPATLAPSKTFIDSKPTAAFESPLNFDNKPRSAFESSLNFDNKPTSAFESSLNFDSKPTSAFDSSLNLAYSPSPSQNFFSSGTPENQSDTFSSIAASETKQEPLQNASDSINAEINQLLYTQHVAKKIRLGSEKWNSSATNSLLVAVRSVGDNEWDKVAILVGENRTPEDCRFRYEQVTAKRSGKWGPEEDEALLKAFEGTSQEIDTEAGTASQFWVIIAEKMDNGRSSKQCQTRYLETLDPSVK